MENKPCALSAFWWIRQIVLTLTGCFFLVFGIQILISAYDLKDPFSFVMTFFASNLIILISGVMVVAFVNRMLLCHRQSGKCEQSD